MVERVINPEIPYFDKEHLWTGGFTALTLMLAFGALDFYLSRRAIAEAALRQREEELREAQRVAGVGSWEWVLGSDTITWSDGVRHLLGYDRTHPAPTLATLGAYFAAESWANLEGAVERVVSLGEPYELDVAMRRADGTSLWTTTRGEPVRNHGGSIIGLRGTVLDITERKQAEEALRAVTERLTLAVAAGRVAIWDYDVVHDTFVCDDAMFGLYGITRDQFGGAYAAWREGLHPDDRVRADDEVQRALRGEQDFDTEFRVVWPGGNIHHIRALAKVQRDHTGRAIRMIGTNWDISDQKQAAAEKATFEFQLQHAQRLESVGRLAGGVAHEFNNMLGVILGNLEFALRRVDPSQPLHAELMEIRAASQRSADLTRQLLAYARKQAVQPVVLDLNDAVSNQLAMLQPLIGANIHLTWVPDTTLWPVLKDPSQLASLLTSLCLNARDAIVDVGTIALATANCTLDTDFCARHPADAVPGDYVRLTVTDTGRGMDAETLDMIFEPFFTTKVVGEGTGLGLPSVFGALKQNGGFITVTSAVGEGTTFELYWPRLVGEVKAARRSGGVTMGARGHETILLVEDEPAMLRLATRALSAKGYTVLAASGPPRPCAWCGSTWTTSTCF